LLGKLKSFFGSNKEGMELPGFGHSEKFFRVGDGDP
jgi:hypothetical protein